MLQESPSHFLDVNNDIKFYTPNQKVSKIFIFNGHMSKLTFGRNM